MTVLYLLVPVAVMLALCAAAAFRWAARDEQFDDMVAPAVRILEDERSDSVAFDGQGIEAQTLRRAEEPAGRFE